MKVGLLIMAAGLAMSPAFLLAEAENQARFYATQGSGSPMKGFFNKGSARTVFSDPAGEEARANIQYFPSKKPIEAEEEAASDTAPEAQPAKLTQPAQEVKVEQKTAQTKEEKRAELVKNFGAPDEEAPVQAQENAPKPFRAMMAALETGDDELAYKYARQYVRYMGRLQQRSTRVVGLMGTAMEREGMVEQGAWQAAKEFGSDRQYLDAELAENADRAPEQRQLNEEATALLSKARMMEEEGEAPKKAPSQPALDPAQERAQIRQQLAREVPVDAGVKAQVYFFFKPLDSESQKMGRELQGMFASSRGHLDLIAMALTPMSDQEEKIFRSRTGATYAINPDGSNIARMMEVRGVPSTVLVSPRLNKAYAIGGMRKALFVDEVIKMMEGR
jgi:hypothetical protein